MYFEMSRGSRSVGPTWRPFARLALDIPFFLSSSSTRGAVRPSFLTGKLNSVTRSQNHVRQVRFSQTALRVFNFARSKVKF
jgi:hypothetical protein